MSTPTNSDQTQLAPYFLMALARDREGAEADLARRSGQDGRLAPDAFEADVIHGQMEAMVFMVLLVRRSLAPSAKALS